MIVNDFIHDLFVGGIIIMTNNSNPLLGQLLVDKGVISSDQLQTALDEQKKSKVPLGELLVRLGFVQDAIDVLPCVSEQIGVAFKTLKDVDIPQCVIELIPSQLSTHFKMIPVSLEGQTLIVAAVNPLDVPMLDVLGMVYPGRVKTVISSEKEILEAIRRYYGVGAETIDRMMGSSLDKNEDIQITEDITQLDDEASIGKFINQILLEAHKDRATDIHIEPYENRLAIRYRIDGILHDARVPANIWFFRDSIASRIKIMSNLNIAERRLAQDGRFKFRTGDLEMDMRVSFLPTPNGESIALRVLSSSNLYSLTELGMDSRDLKVLEGLIRRTHGIIFVTGPTGSGKTTTLYSCLTQIDRKQKKIITIEDPIEYRLDGATQIQVHPAIGLTFASGLRSMLRHDPDVMMVGEVRDLETAQIAIQIALTGHLVFSTLHTNDAASGVTRLIDMGVEPYLITSSVECFAGQRLVRLLCPKCKRPGRLNAQTAADLGLDAHEIKDVRVFEPVGCSSCGNTGYRGRQGLYEFMLMDDAIRQLIMARAPSSDIKAAAMKAGMRTMAQDGWKKVLSGITSPAEVLRVVREEG